MSTGSTIRLLYTKRDQIDQTKTRIPSLNGAKVFTKYQDLLAEPGIDAVQKQIGAEIGVSEATVKLHRGRLMHKMKAESLADLIRMAERLEDPAKR